MCWNKMFDVFLKLVFVVFVMFDVVVLFFVFGLDFFDDIGCGIIIFEV